MGFLVNLKARVMSGISLLQFMAGQLLYLHPLNAVLWIWGLIFLFSARGKGYRLFGWIWVTTFLLLTLNKSKIYYLAPLSLPFLSIDATERYVNIITFGAFKNIYELTGDLRGMFGWPERVAAVAIDQFGKAYGLPPAVSLDMSYWLWSYPKEPFETVITAGFPPETLGKIFDRVEVWATVELLHVNPWQTPFYVARCQGFKAALDRIWSKNRPW